MSAGYPERQKGSIASRTPVPKLYRPSVASLSFRTSGIFKVGKGGFKTPRYQNTYRLWSANAYKGEVGDKILEEVMNDTLGGVKYHPIVCMRMCASISAEVRERIVKKGYQRYRYVVWVSIIQKLGQSMQINVGNLWDVERDTYSTYTLDAPEYVAVGFIAALYYE